MGCDVECGVSSIESGAHVVLQSFSYWLHVDMASVACRGLYCVWLEKCQRNGNP